jgi:hypothetical protein
MGADDIELTPLQYDERAAMLLDRPAIWRVVSALRGYRAECRALLADRYRDGEVDGARLSSFASHVEDIEASDNPIVTELSQLLKEAEARGYTRGLEDAVMFLFPGSGSDYHAKQVAFIRKAVAGTWLPQPGLPARVDLGVDPPVREPAREPDER